MKLFFSVFLLISSLVSFCQLPEADKDSVVDANCDGKIFTRCENPPKIEYIKLYQNKLNEFMQQRNKNLQDGQILFYVTIDKSGELFDFNVQENSCGDIELIKLALMDLKGDWKSGKQNGHPVCAYKKLKMDVINGAITIVE